MFPVTDGHEVSRREALQEQYAHQILTEIEAGHDISQRTLASRLGIALGMTNLLLRRLVRKGLIRVSRIKANRVTYFLTPHGMAEKARMSRAYFMKSVELYASARERVRGRFQELSRAWPAGDGEPKRVLFVGTGELAEIAYICLQETDFELVGAVDFHHRERFFGAPLYRASAPAAVREHVAPQRTIAVAFADNDAVRAFLREAGFPPEQVFWI